MQSLSPVIEVHDFVARDFVGGDTVLDFVNTVTGRDQTPRDWLDGYPRLLEWAGKTKLLPAEVLRLLEKAAMAAPAAANQALKRAKHLREALFVIVAGIISGNVPPASAMDVLNQHWQAGVMIHELRYGKRNVRLEIRTSAIDLDVIASLIAYRFVERVLPEPRERLRICAGSNCSWLFLDHSKAGRRRWCDMAVCGNSAKSRRFYARKRGEKGVSRKGR
jgi:predicted RNA-binding Zn ribbon-like protein